MEVNPVRVKVFLDSEMSRGRGLVLSYGGVFWWKHPKNAQNDLKHVPRGFWPRESVLEYFRNRILLRKSEHSEQKF